MAVGTAIWYMCLGESFLGAVGGVSGLFLGVPSVTTRDWVVDKGVFGVASIDRWAGEGVLYLGVTAKECGCDRGVEVSLRLASKR